MCPSPSQKKLPVKFHKLLSLVLRKTAPQFWKLLLFTLKSLVSILPEVVHLPISVDANVLHVLLPPHVFLMPPFCMSLFHFRNLSCFHLANDMFHKYSKDKSILSILLDYFLSLILCKCHISPGTIPTRVPMCIHLLKHTLKKNDLAQYQKVSYIDTYVPSQYGQDEDLKLMNAEGNF